MITGTCLVCVVRSIYLERGVDKGRKQPVSAEGNVGS